MSSYFEVMNRHRRDVPAVQEPFPVAPRPVARAPRSDGLPSGHAALRESLIAQSNGHPLKTVVFAGCEGGEGCTRLVGGFAKLLADSGLHVLLVDADPRGLEVLDVWQGARDVVETVSFERVLPTGVAESRLTMVRSPASVPDKERFFHGGTFACWLDLQRRTYDYVLIDAPPLLRCADATVMGRSSDGLVIVVAAGSTDKSHLIRARKQLERAQVNVIGAVLNGVSDPIPPLLRRHFSILRD
jgi:Mrp family chromosome partitioning ATPase